MNNFEVTSVLERNIKQCDDQDTFKTEIVEKLQTQQDRWKDKITEIITNSGYSKTMFAKKCGISRQSVDKWCKGSIPKNRDTFVKIGIIAGYDLNQMNDFLTKYGQYSTLYSKNIEDCVCIYILNNDFGKESIDQFNYIMGKVENHFIKEYTENELLLTEVLDDRLAKVTNEEELDQFIEENMNAFSQAYRKFYVYVNTFIETNFLDSANPSYYKYKNVTDIALSQNWSSSLKQCVSAIRQKKWLPNRNKIISLGLHFCMDREKIDYMLTLAHMGKLYPRNIFDSVIIYMLQDASQIGILTEGMQNNLDRVDEFFTYVKEEFSGLGLQDIDEFLKELEIDDE